MFVTVLLLTVATFSPVMHPLHVAYTNIDINREEKTIYVTHKIFTQDFTLLFAHLFEKTIEPQPDIEFTQAEKDLIAHYMKYRFNLVCDSDTLDLDYTGKEMDEESLFLRYKAPLPENGINELTINNLLLLDLYMDQTNLVIVNIDDQEKGFRFDWDNRIHSVPLAVEVRRGQALLAVSGLLPDSYLCVANK